MTLLPCPFCGNNLNQQDWRDTVYPINQLRTMYQIVCQDCSATILADNPDHAVLLWNTRSNKNEHNQIT